MRRKSWEMCKHEYDSVTFFWLESCFLRFFLVPFWILRPPQLGCLNMLSQWKRCFCTYISKAFPHSRKINRVMLEDKIVLGLWLNIWLRTSGWAVASDQMLSDGVWVQCVLKMSSARPVISQGTRVLWYLYANAFHIRMKCLREMTEIYLLPQVRQCKMEWSSTLWDGGHTHSFSPRWLKLRSSLCYQASPVIPFVEPCRWFTWTWTDVTNILYLNSKNIENIDNCFSHWCRQILPVSKKDVVFFYLKTMFLNSFFRFVDL